MTAKTYCLLSVFAAVTIYSARCDLILPTRNSMDLQTMDPSTQQKTDSNCWLTATVDQTSSSKITLSQNWHDPTGGTASMPASNCAYQNFTFNAIFRDDTVNDGLTYVVTNDGSTYANSIIDVSVIQKENGTGCVYLPQRWNGYDQYLCQMVYAWTPFYLSVYGSGNFTFSTSKLASPGLVMSWWQGENKTSYFDRYSWNTTIPPLLGNLLNGCNYSTSRNHSSLSEAVTVTSTVNLTVYLPGFWVSYVVIKQKYATGSNYSVIVSNSNKTVFDTYAPTSCWDLGIKYGDILTDLNYCKDYCQVSLVMSNGNQTYILQTAGIWTIPGNSTNATTTNTTTTNGGTGNNNGLNSTVSVKSALLMIIRLGTLAITFVYLL